jgi:hypothetical protein
LFAITVPGDVRNLTVTPQSGALAAGHSVQVAVTLHIPDDWSLNTQLVVQPRGLAVSVTYTP